MDLEIRLAINTTGAMIEYIIKVEYTYNSLESATQRIGYATFGLNILRLVTRHLVADKTKPDNVCNCKTKT